MFSLATSAVAFSVSDSSSPSLTKNGSCSSQPSVIRLLGLNDNLHLHVEVRSSTNLVAKQDIIEVRIIQYHPHRISRNNRCHLKTELGHPEQNSFVF